MIKIFCRSAFCSFLMIRGPEDGAYEPTPFHFISTHASVPALHTAVSRRIALAQHARRWAHERRCTWYSPWQKIMTLSSATEVVTLSSACVNFGVWQGY